MRNLIRRSDFYLIPNVLTVSRVFAVPLVVLLSYFGFHYSSGVVFALAGISDYIDGWIARKYNYESKLGILLDPLADKLIVVSTMIMLLWQGVLQISSTTPGMELLGPVLVMVTVGREIAITGLRAIASTEGIVLPADRGGKLKTWFQFFAILFLLVREGILRDTGMAMLVISVIAALWSGISYTYRFVRGLPQ